VGLKKNQAVSPYGSPTFGSGLNPSQPTRKPTTEPFDFTKAPLPKQQNKQLEKLFPEFKPQLGKPVNTNSPDILNTGGFMQDINAGIDGSRTTSTSRSLDNALQAYDAAHGEGASQAIQQGLDAQDLGALESMGNSFKNMATRLQGTIPRLNIVAADAWEKVLGKELTKKWYEFEGRDIDEVRYQAYEDLKSLAEEVKPTLEISGGIEKGSLKDVSAGLVNGITSLGSTALPAALTGGAATFTEMMGDALVDFNTEKAKRLGVSVNDLYNMDQAEFNVPALAGALGGGLELIGLKGVKNLINKNLVGQGFKKAALYFGAETQKEGLTELVQTGIETANKALGEGKSWEEAGKMAVNDMFSKKGLEAYLQGVVASGAVGGTSHISDLATTPQAKTSIADDIRNIGLMEMDLQKPELTPQSQQILTDQINQSISNIANTVEADDKVVNKLDDKQKAKVDQISQQIDQIDAVLADPAVSEDTKSAIEAQKKPLEEKLKQTLSEEPVVEEMAVEEPVYREVVIDGKTYSVSGNNVIDVETGSLLPLSLSEDAISTRAIKEYNKLEKQSTSNETKKEPVTKETVVEEVAPVAEETATPAVEETVDLSEAVLQKAEDDIETLKQVKNKTAKYDASVKRLNTALKEGTITQKQFDDTKARFDDIIGQTALKPTKGETNNAIQERKSDESVLRKEQSQVGLQEVERGNESVKPEKVSVNAQKEEKVVKAGDPIRAFAEKVRSGKINKLGGFKSSTGFDGVWDLGLEAVATSIDQGAKVADAIESGLTKIKESDWYKNLSNKSEFDSQYKQHLLDNFTKETRYWEHEGKSQTLTDKALRDRISELASKPELTHDESIENTAISDEHARRLRTKLMDADLSEARSILKEMEDSNRQVIPAKQIPLIEGIIDKYSDTKDLSDKDIESDFKNSMLTLSKTAASDPTVWANRLGLREAVKELTTRGYSKNNIIDLAKSEFNKYQYDAEKANTKIDNILKPVLDNVKGRPLSDAIRKFAGKIREGKINKLGGFKAGTGFDAAWDLGLEAVATTLEGGATVIDAINAGLKAIKQTDWYKKLENKEEFDKQYTSHMNSEYGISESELKETTLRNKDVAEKRKDYGFEEREAPTSKSDSKLREEASKAIEDGYDVHTLMDDIIFDKKVTSDKEQLILAQYQAGKEAELITLNKAVEDAVESGNDTVLRKAQSERDNALDDLQKAYQASEQSGTELGRALRSRQLKVMQDYSLANMFIQKRKANGGQKLTEEQIQSVQEQYEKISKLNSELQDRVAKLEEKNKKLEAKKALDRLKRENSRNRRSLTKDQILDNRKKILDNIFEIAKKQRSNLSANPIPLEMIAPITQLAKTYIQEGIVNLDELVETIHNNIKDAFDDLQIRDVRDALSGYGRENELTKDDISATLKDLKDQARLVSKIEDKEAGLKNIKPESATYGKASAELQALRDQLKEMNADEQSLSALKKRLKDRIDELSRRIKEKDFITVKDAREYPLDEEALKLRDELNQAKFDYEVSLLKDKMKQRTTLEKIGGVASDVLAIPRSLMSSVDFSAPFRQGLVLTISHPFIASKAFMEMFKQAFSKSKHDRWLNDLKASPMYGLMKDSGLYIADDRSPSLTAREEDFMSNLAEKIPIIGQTLNFKVGGKNVKIPGTDLIGGSQRAYSGYLNKLRADIFTQGVDQFYANGNTIGNSPELFKALGSYINTATGRGSLGKFENSSAVLSALFFSPRLLASRFRLLTNPINPYWWQNTPKAVRNMYFGDMAKTIGFGASMLAIASLGFEDDDEVTVNYDPRSPDFGKIKVGDVRYDIWGGLQQFVRNGAQMLNYAAYNVIPKENRPSWMKKKPKSAGDVFEQFVRSKLSPVTGFITNAMYGKNVVGREFDLKTDLSQLFFPLAAADIVSDMYNGEPQKFFTKGIPSIFGVGVQEYNNKSTKSKQAQEKDK